MKDGIESNRLVHNHKLEALGQFAGGIAHDFNNILSIIEGYTHVAVKQLDEGSLKKDQLDKILKSTQRAAGLTRQLLSFGRQKVDIDEKTSLSKALRQQHVLLKPVLGASIGLYMTLPEEDVWINTSEDQLTQIVLNLALNARDAITGEGEFGVICMPCHKLHVPKQLKALHPDTSFIRLSFVDSGSGIPADVLPRIFDPFFTTKDAGKGTGLGLSVVYGIVDQLKGGIEVSSTLGEGTSFDIYLPTTTPPAVIQEEEQTDLTSIAGKTILIAEDEPELRGILSDMFKSMKVNVLTASNGNDALLVQDRFDGEIDFLLTDVVMPEMNGVKLGEMFQSLRPDANIVYMSGYPFMDGRQDIKVPEGAPFISKPLQEDKIRKILERALQRKQQRLEE